MTDHLSRDRQEKGKAQLLQMVKARATVDFVTWLFFMYPQTPDTSYILSRFHIYLAKLCQAVMTGEALPKYAISCPPQHGKSRMMAVRLVAWAAGAYPGISIAMTGFSHTLLTDFVHEVVAIIEEPRYVAVFGDVKTIRGRGRMDSKFFSNGSSIIVKSSGSKLTGRHVDLLIIDDPHSGRSDAESVTSRSKIIQWYYADCLSRVTPTAKQFIIATRWHKEDLIGHLTHPDRLKELQASGSIGQRFGVVNLPALAVSDNDPLGRKPGQALFPEVRNEAFLEGIRAEQPLHEWESQYQGNPITVGGGQVDTSKLKYIDIHEIPSDLTIIRGWDLALTESKRSDYSVGALCGYLKDKDLLYIIDTYRDRKVWSKLRPKIKQITLNDISSWNLSTVGLEAVSGQLMGYEDLKEDLSGLAKIELRNPKHKDKLARAQPWFNKVEAGKVILVRGNWCRDFILELETFPVGDHDDQIDAVTIAYECLNPRKRRLLF